MNERKGLFYKPGIVLESVTIVVSILLAITIDAWWDTRAETMQTNSQLHSIRVELSYIGNSVSSSRTRLEQSRLAVIEILSLIGPEASLVPPDKILEVVDLSFRAGSIELEAGSITALLSSGELSSIKDIELQSHIASWQAQITRVRNKSAQLEENRESIIEYLHDILPTLDITHKTGQMTRYPTSDFEAKPAQFQGDMRLEGLFANRGMLIEDTEVQLINVQELIAHITRLIDVR